MIHPRRYLYRDGTFGWPKSIASIKVSGWVGTNFKGCLKKLTNCTTDDLDAVVVQFKPLQVNTRKEVKGWTEIPDK